MPECTVLRLGFFFFLFFEGEGEGYAPEIPLDFQGFLSFLIGTLIWTGSDLQFSSDCDQMCSIKGRAWLLYLVIWVQGM